MRRTQLEKHPRHLWRERSRSQSTGTPMCFANTLKWTLIRSAVSRKIRISEASDKTTRPANSSSSFFAAFTILSSPLLLTGDDDTMSYIRHLCEMLVVCLPHCNLKVPLFIFAQEKSFLWRDTWRRYKTLLFYKTYPILSIFCSLAANAWSRAESRAESDSFVQHCDRFCHVCSRERLAIIGGISFSGKRPAARSSARGDGGRRSIQARGSSCRDTCQPQRRPCRRAFAKSRRCAAARAA